MQKEVVKIHIENDVVNNAPTVVFTDVDGVEWVQHTDSVGNMTLQKKSKSWYWKRP